MQSSRETLIIGSIVYAECNLGRRGSVVVDFQGFPIVLSWATKANLIKPCKTGKGGSNFQKPGTFGNIKVLPFQNHYFLFDQMIFGDFMAILAKETVIF